ncbi:unnamed protein product [Strongylus vulgaris]|uniref:Uncharacterized protein n=1 Tax=Strongylus vulgaris TaxID=40348 RepID=A0A3P7I735_STRVU|nr:unnamed protein product [Strongylus vulgaris]
MVVVVVQAAIAAAPFSLGPLAVLNRSLDFWRRILWHAAANTSHVCVFVSASHSLTRYLSSVGPARMQVTRALRTNPLQLNVMSISLAHYTTRILG